MKKATPRKEWPHKDWSERHTIISQVTENTITISSDDSGTSPSRVIGTIDRHTGDGLIEWPYPDDPKKLFKQFVLHKCQLAPAKF